MVWPCSLSRDGAAPLLRHLHPFGHEPALDQKRIPFRRYGRNGGVEPADLVRHAGRIGCDLVSQDLGLGVEGGEDRCVQRAAGLQPLARGHGEERLARRDPVAFLDREFRHHAAAERADAHGAAGCHEGAAGGFLAGIFGCREKQHHDGRARQDEAAEELP